MLHFPESVPPSLIQELELPISESTINVHLPAFVSTEEMSSVLHPQTNVQTALHLHNTNSNGAISSRIFDWINMVTERGGSWREADDEGGEGSVTLKTNVQNKDKHREVNKYSEFSQQRFRKANLTYVAHPSDMNQAVYKHLLSSHDLDTPHDEGTKFSRNVGIRLTTDAAWYSWIMQSSD